MWIIVSIFLYLAIGVSFCISLDIAKENDGKKITDGERVAAVILWPMLVLSLIISKILF